MSISRRSLLKGVSAGLLAAPWISRGALAAGGTITVGGIHDLSGPLGSLGVPMYDSLKLAVDRVNESGGLVGKKLKLVHYDAQSNNQLYTQYAQQLALKDRADVVFGAITSASREAIRPIFDRYKILYFYNNIYEGGVCDEDTFVTGTTPAQTLEKLIPYIVAKWGKKLYVVAADYNFGRLSADWVRKYAKDNGATVVGADFFPLDQTDFGASLNKIQAAKPDALVSVLVGGNHIGFYRQWAAAGIKKEVPLASITFGLFDEQVVLQPAESEGVIGVAGYYDVVDTPENKAFVDALHKRFGKLPSIGEPACETYEAVQLWAEGVKKAGSADRGKVTKALETGISIKGPSGTVTVDHQTHHVTRNAYIAEIHNRNWVILASYENLQPSDTAAVCNLIKNPRQHKQYTIKL